MAEDVEREEDVPSRGAWFLAGALAGLAAGAVIAERTQGARRLVRFVRDARHLANPAIDAAMDLWADYRTSGRKRRARAELLEHDAVDARAPEMLDGPEADRPLSARILSAFENDPVLSARAVEIDCDEDGAVTLDGFVRSKKEMARALTLARGVPGVRGVRQHLRVRERRT